MAIYKNPVVARVEQMIRVPAPAVFAAFTEPKELKKFWLSKASAPLEEGKSVEWHFKVRGVKDELRVLALEPHRRIRVQWSDRATTEWTFTPLGRGKTIVRVEHSWFVGEKPGVRCEERRAGEVTAFSIEPRRLRGSKFSICGRDCSQARGARRTCFSTSSVEAVGRGAERS